MFKGAGVSPRAGKNRMMVFVLWWCIVMSVLVSGSGGDARHGCGEAAQQLVKIGVAPPDFIESLPSNGSSVCSGGQCCSPELSAALLQHGAQPLRSALLRASARLRSTITTRAAALTGAVSEALTESEQQTLQVFRTSYPRLMGHVQPVLHSLFAGLRNSIHHTDSTSREMVLSKFWDDLFPGVYHSAVHAKMPPFTETYSNCIRDSRKTIRPWGIVPALVDDQVNRLVEAARLLLHALHTAVRTLEVPESYVWPVECLAASARTTTCGLCHAVVEPPCPNLCLNVARGCLAPLAEIGGGWADLVSGVARAGRALRAARTVLDRLPDNLPDAVLVAMETGPKLQKKVRRQCGPPTHLPAPASSDQQPASAHHSQATILHAEEDTRSNHKLSAEAQADKHNVVAEAATNASSSSSEKQDGGSYSDASTALEQNGGNGSATTYDGLANTESARDRKWRGEVLIKQIVKEMYATREWWQSLANVICNNVTKKHDKEHCWNGEHLGPYTRDLAGVGISAQKYNPEIKVARPDNSAYATADTLRSVKRLIMSRITWLPESASSKHDSGSPTQQPTYGAGVEKPDSGSGSYYDQDDEDSYGGDYDGSGYGSGDGAYSPDGVDEGRVTTNDKSPNTQHPHFVGGRTTAGVSSLLSKGASSFMLPLAALLLIARVDGLLVAPQ